VIRPDPTLAWCSRLFCPANSHDTYTAARYGCSSPAAWHDRRRYQKLRRHGRPTGHAHVPNGPSIRMLRALAAAGFSFRDLGQRSGLNPSYLRRLALGDYDRKALWQSTAAAIRVVYLELWDQLGPCDRIREEAAGRGWYRAIFYDSPTFATDEPPKLGLHAAGGQRADTAWRAEEVRRRTAAGEDAATIAEALGVTARTVVRYRERLALAAEEAIAS
jgi:hypothetical protein